MLRDARRHYQPKIPSLLSEPQFVQFQKGSHLKLQLPKLQQGITALFPHTSSFPVLQGVKTTSSQNYPVSKIGVLFSGGPAPGGHNVVAAIFDTLNRCGKKHELIGFLGGPEALVSGVHKRLDRGLVDRYRNQGGFDLLGSGRTKLKTPQQFQQVADALLKLKLDGLIIIGGDDSNTNAAYLAEYFLQKEIPTRIIGVPKTIDGDVQNPYVAIPFGFDTAAKIYSEMIGNLAHDTISSLKYVHFIKLMGRSASHLTLECALNTLPNITLISEEKKPFRAVIDQLATWVEKRASLKTPYGMVLIPEGLLESMPDLAPLFQNTAPIFPDKFDASTLATWHQLPENIQKQLTAERDSHGNIYLSGIATELLLIEAVQKELKRRAFQGIFQPIPHFYGYEGRCGYPSNFDANYSYALGATAALLVLSGHTAQMAYVKRLHEPPSEWQFGGVPFPPLLKLSQQPDGMKAVIHKTFVDLRGAPFKKLKSHEAQWMTHSAYGRPGPIQFEGPSSITDSHPQILQEII